MLQRQVTHTNIVRVLAVGFGLVILLLALAGFIGVRNIRSIRQNAASLVQGQSLTNRLIDELQRQQVSFGEVFSVLARDPDSVDSERILAQLGEADRNIDRIADAGLKTPQQKLWMRLREASHAFSGEARRLLSIEDPETFSSRDLFRLHEQFIAVTARLIESNYRKILGAQEQIDADSELLGRQSLVLVGACLVLALVTTALTVRLAAQLVREMEWQTGELSRVSWHMVERPGEHRAPLLPRVARRAGPVADGREGQSRGAGVRQWRQPQARLTIACTWWTRRSRTSGSFHSCCGLRYSTISGWRLDCAGSPKASCKRTGIEVRVPVRCCRPAA